MIRAMAALVALVLTMTGFTTVVAAQPVSNGGFVSVPGPTVTTTTRPGDYRIGPFDKLNINVYQMKDLTLSDVQVDAAGRITLPLIGSIEAAGKTAPELSDEIAGMLRGRYLQQPQVTVWVTDAASQKVTVDGAVVQPGVYTLSGPTTLIQAVAMAKGPDLKYANLRRVVVFRTINGQRAAAVFDLKLIRQGKAEDPAILGNDVIVVDGSQTKGAWREIIGALPVLGVFRYF